jgi:hypothetical protein
MEEEIKKANHEELLAVALLYNKTIEELIDDSDSTGPGWSACEALDKLRHVYNKAYRIIKKIEKPA